MIETFETLVNDGSIIECAACGAFNAYAWQDSNIDPNSDERILPSDGIADGGEEYTTEELPTLLATEDVYHIGAASCFDWQCGKCGLTNVELDSPTLAEVYTHVAA